MGLRATEGSSWYLTCVRNCFMFYDCGAQVCRPCATICTKIQSCSKKLFGEKGTPAEKHPITQQPKITRV